MIFTRYKKAFLPVASIGSTYFETAVGGNRLYFIQYESLKVARKIFSEDEREIDPSSPEYVDRKLHWRSISGDDPRIITDHGPVIDQDGRAASMIMSMSADDKGHIFSYMEAGIRRHSKRLRSNTCCSTTPTGTCTGCWTG